jgi:hypothetical protein
METTEMQHNGDNIIWAAWQEIQILKPHDGGASTKKQQMCLIRLLTY